MLKRMSAVLAVAAVLTLVQSCVKQTEISSEINTATMKQLDVKIDGPVIARNQDLLTILQLLQKETGVTILLDPGINKKVTFSLDRPTVRQVLDTVLPANGLTYAAESADTVRIKKADIDAIPEPAVSMGDLSSADALKKRIEGPIVARNQDLHTILMLLQSEGKIQIVLGEGIATKVSLNLNSPTIAEVLEAIMKETGLECSVMENGVVVIRKKSTDAVQ